jgi:acrylyl-CoA reductase (NADPH)
MKSRFKAILVRKDNDVQTADDVELSPADLMEGDVVVAVSHSTVNYKDGLVLTGRAPVARRFPMIPGIDSPGRSKSLSIPTGSRATRSFSTATGSAKRITAAIRNSRG